MSLLALSFAGALAQRRGTTGMVYAGIIALGIAAPLVLGDFTFHQSVYPLK